MCGQVQLFVHQCVCSLWWALLTVDGLVVGLILVYVLWVAVVMCEQLLHSSSWVVVLWVMVVVVYMLWLVFCGQLSGSSLWAVVACWWVVILGAGHGHGRSLAFTAANSWPFVFVGACFLLLFVIVGSSRCLPCGHLLSVGMCVVGGGGKDKRGHVMLPNKYCLLFITNI